MKGSLKTMRTYDTAQTFTNFNDWSDPKPKPLKRKISFKNPLKIKQDLYQYSTTSECSHTSLDIEELRHKIKVGYPLLSRREIRAFKLPFHENLLLNLEEDGFIGTYEFLKDLFILDEEWHKKQENDSLTKRQNLKSSCDVLELLCNMLITAELAKLEKNKSIEINSFLKLALHFSHDMTWIWLAEELYEQCVNIADSRNTDMPMLEAIAKYLFASFLLKFKHNPRRAKHFIEESMNLSVGESWNTSEITGQKNDILYIESCLLLHKIYLSMFQDITNFEEAVELCRSSLFWAKQANSKFAEITALRSLVMVYLSENKMNPVVDNLDSYMKLCTELNYMEGLCDGYILLATYHDLEEQDILVIECMQKLLKVAQENKLIKMMATAHHKLATFYLKQGRFKDMEENASKAYDYYIQINSKLDMEETMCLTGIAQAQDVMSQYIKLILQAEDLGLPEFQILRLWKTLHIPFFSNKKLFQPEADINLELKNRIELMKNEETLLVNKLRQDEIAKVYQRSSNSLPKMMYHDSNTSVSSFMYPERVHVSHSFINFKRNMTRAVSVQGSFISLVHT